MYNVRAYWVWGRIETDVDIERTMEFILEQQARSAEQQARFAEQLAAQQANFEERLIAQEERFNRRQTAWPGRVKPLPLCYPKHC